MGGRVLETELKWAEKKKEGSGEERKVEEKYEL